MQDPDLDPQTARRPFGGIRTLVIVSALAAIVAVVGVGIVVDAGPNDEKTPVAANLPRQVDQPEELGDVQWRRGFETAQIEARTTGKPLLVLFDEVPGCHTVKTYGKGVLRHPLIVEAAETHFVPVVVYNNVEGDDREVLNSFGERTWNNPVVRIMTADRKELVPRVAGDYTAAGLATAMSEALGKGSPTWLRLLAEETSARRAGTKKATFAMYCFWTGEAHLGQKEGVVSTATGFAEGHEVVRVEYDPKVVSRDDLASYAQKAKIRPLDTKEFRGSSKDDRYRLRDTAWRHVPMLGIQASRANAAISRREDPALYFSPRQRRFAQLAARSPQAGWPQDMGMKELTGSWALALAASAAE
jgi:hypothetical protein